MNTGRALLVSAAILWPVYPVWAAQDDPMQVRLSVGIVNSGQFVAEPVRRVRMGDRSWSRFGAAAVAQGPWRARLMASPTHVFVWPTAGPHGRFDSPPDGATQHRVIWLCLSGAAAVEWWHVEASAGPQACSFAGGGAWWGAPVGVVFGPRLAVRLRMWVFAVSGSVAPLYVSDARWTVLRKAGALQDTNRHPWRAHTPNWLWPLAVEFSIGVGGD